MKKAAWIACGALLMCTFLLGNWVLRLRSQLEEERQFWNEQRQSLLAESVSLSQKLAVSRIARNPVLLELAPGVTAQVDLGRHNELLLITTGMPHEARLSATIFDATGRALLTNPTLTPQSGSRVMLPLFEGAVEPGEYEIQLFLGTRVVGKYRIRAVRMGQ